MLDLLPHKMDDFFFKPHSAAPDHVPCEIMIMDDKIFVVLANSGALSQHQFLDKRPL